MSTTKRPKSFPNRISWLRAITLITTCLSIDFLAKLLSKSDTELALWKYFSWIASPTLMAVYRYCFTVYSSKGKAWKPDWNLLKEEGCWALKVNVWASVLGSFCVSLYFYLFSVAAVFVGVSSPIVAEVAALFPEEQSEILKLVEIFSRASWIVLVPFFYQDRLVKQWERAKKTAKAKKSAKGKAKKTSPNPKQTPSKSRKLPPPPEPPIDPLEAELNRLSAERWLSENQKWECFRSGPVGPYTKEELRSIQKITAKTNVRRVGETDWTRAGQIPELAEFLTVKS